MKDDFKKFIFERTGHLVFEPKDAPPQRIYVVWVYARRGTGKEWVSRLVRSYPELDHSDVRLQGESKKPEGSTLFLRLSQKAVDFFKNEDLEAFVGAAGYKLREWEPASEDKLAEEEDEEEIQ